MSAWSRVIELKRNEMNKMDLKKCIMSYCKDCIWHTLVFIFIRSGRREVSVIMKNSWKSDIEDGVSEKMYPF